MSAAQSYTLLTFLPGELREIAALDYVNTTEKRYQTVPVSVSLRKLASVSSEERNRERRENRVSVQLQHSISLYDKVFGTRRRPAF